MPAFSTLTLQNNAAVNVVFTPSKIDSNGVATYYAPASTLDARPSFSLLVKQPVNGSKVARVSGKLVVPVMDPLDASIRLGECLGSFEFVFHKSATETQRLDTRKLLDTSIQNAIATAAVQYLESVY